MTGHIYYVGGHHIVSDHIAGCTDQTCDIHASGCKYCYVAYPAHIYSSIAPRIGYVNGCGAIFDVIARNITTQRGVAGYCEITLDYHASVGKRGDVAPSIASGNGNIAVGCSNSHIAGAIADAVGC